MKALLRIGLVALVALDFLTPTVGLIQADAQSATITSPFLTGPQDPSQITGTVNSLVIAINAILSPLTGPNVSGGVNSIGHLTGITGTPAIIDLQSGADANAGIQIIPNGTGNIIMFSPTNTGVIQIANLSGWYPAKGAGVVPCPGGGAGANLNGNLAAGLLQGGNQTIAGYEVHEDWLARPYWIPGCR